MSFGANFYSAALDNKYRTQNIYIGAYLSIYLNR